MSRKKPINSLDALSRAALDVDPSRDLLEFEGRWYKGAEFRMTANAVRTAIGPAAGSVAFVARNRPSALSALLGLLAEARTIRMVYPFLSDDALIGELRQIGPAAVVADAQDLTAPVQDYLRSNGIVTVELQEMTVLVSPGDAPTASDRGGAKVESPSIEILTSGTTGPPKPFALRYSQIVDHVLGETVQPMAQTGDPAERPPMLLMFPVSNISGLYSTLPPLLSGQRVVLLEKFTVEGWHKYVVEYRPVMSGMPPAGLQMVLDADIPPGDLASLQVLGTGAAPLDPRVKRAFEQRFGIPVLLSYGATEFAGPVTRMTPEIIAEWGDAKYDSVGRALPGVKLRVVHPETGVELRAGQQGVLEVVSPRIGPDWIRTSDLAVIDEEGFLFHKGRADGAIMRGGFKLLPATIEHGLLSHPAIAQACVIGIPDQRLGEVPAAAVELKSSAPASDIADIEAHLRRQVPATHIPAAWRFVDALPRTPSMKVDLPAVRRLFMEAHG